MNYPGGKGASGAYQQVINQIPPHRVYIEPFVGGGAVFRHKAPAASSVLADLDREVVEKWRARALPPGTTVRHQCAMDLLSSFPWVGDEFVYLDPPYHFDARSGRRIYRCELEDADHRRLLQILSTLPAMWCLSGYRCELYDDAAASFGWRRVDFQAMTRGGVRTESLWMNYPAPARIAETTYAGSGFRERERIKRKATRWANKLKALPHVERQAILAMLASADDAVLRDAGVGEGSTTKENHHGRESYPPQ